MRDTQMNTEIYYQQIICKLNKNGGRSVLKGETIAQRP